MNFVVVEPVLGLRPLLRLPEGVRADSLNLAIATGIMVYAVTDGD